MNMDAKLDKVVERHVELATALASERVDPGSFAKMSKEYAELTPITDEIKRLRQALAEIEGLDEIIADASTEGEMKALAEAERGALAARIPKLQRAVQILLLPKDEADAKSAILDLKAATGGYDPPLRLSP